MKKRKFKKWTFYRLNLLLSLRVCMCLRTFIDHHCLCCSECQQNILSQKTKWFVSNIMFTREYKAIFFHFVLCSSIWIYLLGLCWDILFTMLKQKPSKSVSFVCCQYKCDDKISIESHRKVGNTSGNNTNVTYDIKWVKKLK